MTAVTRFLLLGLVLVGLGGVVGTGVGLALEENDAFCTACHTEPEVTYYQRAVAAQTAPPVDLAAAHARLERPLNCIACHSGVTLPERLATLYSLGVRDTVKWLTGRYNRPGRTEHPIPNKNCDRCHQDTLMDTGFENHFHSDLLDPEAPSILCVACHLSHDESGDPRKNFIREVVVFVSCNECHRVMGGPTDLR